MPCYPLQQDFLSIGEVYLYYVLTLHNEAYFTAQRGISAEYIHRLVWLIDLYKSLFSGTSLEQPSFKSLATRRPMSNVYG
jgi:hypothetical protein